MSAAQSSVLFTADYVQIEDLDTEPADLLLTIMNLPTHGNFISNNCPLPSILTDRMKHLNLISLKTVQSPVAFW
jgi:hypothetical protein